MLCERVGKKAVLLFTRAIKAETGLDPRSTGRSLLTGTGDISVQVPRVVDGHRWPNPRTAGMILRVSSRQTGWAPWPEVGAVFREYQMGQAQTLSAAQRAVGRGGPIIGARRVSFRLAVRPGRTVPGSTPLSCPRHPAQMAVLVSTHPSTGPLRYWSETEGPAGRALAETRGSRPRGKQYKHYYATIPARRTWTKGHWYYGRSEGAGRSGGERYHPDRRPQHSRTRTNRRRRFHAGRTPRPRWPHRRAPAHH
jgi:hypothetical protein